MFDNTKYIELPYNGQKGQPCPFGCIMRKNIETNKISLIGDCRAPSSKNCCLNKQYKEQKEH